MNAIVKPTIGDYARRARWRLLLERRIPLRRTTKIAVDKRDEITGAAIQEEATSQTFFQLTAFQPFETMAIPMIPPIHEWVVETGRPYKVAKISHTATPNKTHSMPYINSTYTHKMI